MPGLLMLHERCHRPSLAAADNDPPIKGMPGLLATAIGRNIEEIYAGNNKGG